MLGICKLKKEVYHTSPIFQAGALVSYVKLNFLWLPDKTERDRRSEST